jgi:hypothetical protein
VIDIVHIVEFPYKVFKQPLHVQQVEFVIA